MFDSDFVDLQSNNSGMKGYIILSVLMLCSMVGLGQTEIKMENKGGVYYVPCLVNGIKLNFIFDTGASHVSISLSEASFMLKNGYLKQEDIVGSEYYQIANGEIQEGTSINIKELVIGGVKLQDIKASIVHSAEAPLLLGQSVLEKFGQFYVEYEKNVLVLGSSKNNSSGDRAVFEIVDSRDNHSYQTSRIGEDFWMIENLAWTPYFGSFFLVDESQSINDGSGYLYEYEIAQFACPQGWHLPNNDEWTSLLNSLEIDNQKNFKYSPKGFWSVSGNSGNEFNFVATGYRVLSRGGRNEDVGQAAHWWSATSDSLTASTVSIYLDDSTSVKNSANKNRFAFSVRCVKD